MLWIGSGPLVWKHCFQLGIVGVSPDEYLAQIDPRFDAMPFGSGEDRVQRSPLAAPAFSLPRNIQFLRPTA